MKSNTLKNIIESLSTKAIITHALLLVIGLSLGYYFSGPFSSTDSSELRLGSEKGFTNPLLECEVNHDTVSYNGFDLKTDLESFVAGIKNRGNINQLSVYYRDLNNGQVVSVDSYEDFAPASLLKVPILISYLKWSEDKPEVLDEQIKYDSPVDVGYVQKFAPSLSLIAGQTYTARELLEHMAKYSDNQALVLLYQRLPKSYQQDLYTLLGVDPNIVTNASSTLNIRQYSIFFRILFNASFLTRADSEYALKLLSESTFDKGIKKSVPDSVVVSHKFGERKTENSLQQFHDCGIVYYPNHPYLLCIMTRGSDVNSLIDSIYQTAQMVYKKVDIQYSKSNQVKSSQ